MEIVDFNEKNDSPKENDKAGGSFNTFPNCGDRLTKTNTFSKKINSQTDGLMSPNKKSGLVTLRQTANELNQKYQIHWCAEANSDEQASFSILIDLPEICTVQDCIMMSLKELNKVLQIKQISYSLEENPYLYELFIAKKNGKPKEDYPSYDYDLSIAATKNINFALIHKNNEVFIKHDIQEKKIIFESPKKKVQFSKNSSKNEIIVLPDDESDDNDAGKPFIFNWFCFCFAKRKRNTLINKK